MSEQDQINNVLSGNQAAFDGLVERYQAGLVYHCLALMKDADMAEEMAQESFIKAYFSLRKYHPTYRFSTWLYRIATNTCLDYLRRTQHISLDDIPELPSREHSSLELTVRNDQTRAVRWAVSELPLKYQTVVSLYYWHERSYEEIAMILDTPLGTVKTWLFRAKALLQEKLDGQA